MKWFAHVYPMVHELLGSNLADPSKLDLQDSDESAVLQHMEIFLEFWTPGNLVIISNHYIDQRLLKRCSLFSRLFFFQFTDIHTKSLVNEWWRQKPRTFEKHASITEIHRLSPTMLFSGECRSTEVLLRKWDGIIEKEKRCQHIYIYMF